jgi:hypothetical protein
LVNKVIERWLERTLKYAEDITTDYFMKKELLPNKKINDHFIFR